MGSFGVVSCAVAFTLVCSTVYKYVKHKWRNETKKTLLVMSEKCFSKLCHKYSLRMNHICRSDNFVDLTSSDENDFFFFDQDDNKIYEMVENPRKIKSNKDVIYNYGDACINTNATIFYVESKTKIGKDVFSFFMELFTSHGFNEIYILDPLSLHHFTYEDYDLFSCDDFLSSYEYSLLDLYKMITIVPYIANSTKRSNNHIIFLQPSDFYHIQSASQFNKIYQEFVSSGYEICQRDQSPMFIKNKYVPKFFSTSIENGEMHMNIDMFKIFGHPSHDDKDKCHIDEFL